MTGDDDRRPGFQPVAADRRAAQEAETQLSLAADSVPPSTLEVGSVLAEKYRLTRFLGQGGMGSVWVAERMGLGVPVAVKVMHAWVAAQPQYVERFRREARAALMLSHPNVVRVIDFGQHESTFFLVMEMIEGKALDEWLSESAMVPSVADVVAICADVLDALDAAHRHGIVHRDLKPENVILSNDSQGRRVAKVVDFGLAHVEDPDTHAPTLTKKDMIAGTPAYMSPEQSRSLQVGPSTDLYAFGCLLTELLQKKPPFEAPSAIETISQHLFMPPPPLARPDGSEPVPPLLEALRLELLAKHPHQRPPDAGSVKQRLLESVDREASAARLPPRTGALAGGDRAARVPEWNSGVGPDAPAVHGSVAVVPRAGSLLADPSLLTGLAAHGLSASHSRQLDVAADVVVYDAGGSVDVAVQALGSGPPARVIVVLDHVDAAAMRRLIEAGAADVIAAPVTPDVLARKVKRLLKRR